MRFLIIAAVSVSALALVPGAFAQTAQQSSSPPVPKPPPATTQEGTAAQHPEWFTEPNTYKPCPCSVVFSNGQHACLGLP
jgi:hypothetical protein